MKSSVKSFIAAIGTILMTAVSCNKELAETTDSNLEKHTCEMKLVGSLVNFDGPETRADANATTWADGSVIYLRMASPLGTTTGEAVYSSSKDVWTISYYGSLYEGVSNTCSALYLEDKVSYDNSLFTLNEGTAIYEDLEGSYIFEEGDLVVTANLKPKTGRIRFTGIAGKVLKVYGVTHYETYDIGTDIYTTTTEPFKLTVGEDGYTPYFYGYFTNTEDPNVKVWVDAKEAYTRFCSKEIFNAGQSGKMTIPTADSHNGWVDGLHFNINGAQFKMVAVEGGTFIMGDNTYGYTAHKVTLTGFCIGETEMTELLYRRISDPEYNPTNPSKAYSSFSYSGITSKLNQLNTIENISFDFPTDAQWEYAARGGVKSKGYIYPGSDNIEEVAWYTYNSNGAVHQVKQKLPNELGLYDMAGNVMEYVKDCHYSYTTASQVDPYFPYSGSGDRIYLLRGGSYDSSSDYCMIYYRRTYNPNSYSSSSPAGPGFRLALNWN